jgi:DNA invertase Pin-like site-specific DNA recombinase
MLDNQLEQLRATGCDSRNIYREKVTGARADRLELLRMLNRRAPGDVVTVTRIDRLARKHLRRVRHRQAHRGRQGAIPVTGGIAGRHGRQDWALNPGGARRPADVEREVIRTRTAEGQSRAKAQGRQMGPVQKKEAARRRAEGATLQELARSYNVGISTNRRATCAA